MSSTTRAWLQIHLCVVLWGLTAILGKLITLSASTLVWWRMLMVSVALACVPRVWRGVAALSPKLIATYAGIGILVALHWLAFYSSIKLANASVAATCIATSPVFLACIEPLLTNRRFNWRDVVLGIAVIPAVALVVGGTPMTMHLGILTGVLAALLVAVFGTLNKRFVEYADAITVTGIEMSAGMIFLSIVGPWTIESDFFLLPDTRDAILLFVLASLCTLLPFALSLIALRELSAFSAQLVVNLEPVYAILLAIPIFGEQQELNAQFYVGVIMILGIVFLHPWWNRRAAA